MSYFNLNDALGRKLGTIRYFLPSSYYLHIFCHRPSDSEEVIFRSRLIMMANESMNFFLRRRNNPLIHPYEVVFVRPSVIFERRKMLFVRVKSL